MKNCSHGPPGSHPDIFDCNTPPSSFGDTTGMNAVITDTNISRHIGAGSGFTQTE